jgi:hypothetical protein
MRDLDADELMTITGATYSGPLGLPMVASVDKPAQFRFGRRSGFAPSILRGR